MENKFDKEIEDIGWEKMQALLDKEKPIVGFVPPQSGLQLDEAFAPYESQNLGKSGLLRKRWALVALLFLSLAGCSVWSYYFFKIKLENQQAIVLNNASAIENDGQNLTQNNSPVIASDTKKMMEIQELKKGKNNDLTKWSNSKNANLEKQNKLQNIDNQLIIKNNNPNLKTQNVNNNKEISAILIENKDKIVEEKLTNGLNPLNALNRDNKTQNQEEKFVEKNALENAEIIEARLPFETLNPLVFEPIIDAVSSIEGRPSPSINLKENTQKMLQKWQFGFTLGAHTEGVNRFDGYQVGLILRKNLTQKWAFSTGLNYRKSSTKSRKNASFLAADKANASSSVTTPSSSFNLSKVMEVRLKDMQYLELPLMFDHLVNKRLFVSGGIKMSYLLSKNWIKIDTTNANLYVITYSNQSTKASSSSSNLYDKSSSNFVNNSLDFAILGGINYRISRHFDVSVRYDFGLKNIFKQNNVSVYNRYLGLNVNYYFNYPLSFQF